ncbi:MAG: hypothetical protein M1818_002726 [Claussenomyces sp. TS43310]|nr:MAG: hypothetical protein M1818_002726 [Claussenomyces sp. TS43310]
MDTWNDGQLGLFDALVKVCDSLSDEQATGLSHSIANRDGRSYAQELQDLRARSLQVQGLQRENEYLRAQFEKHLVELAAARQTTVIDITAVPEPSTSLREPDQSVADVDAWPTPPVIQSSSHQDEDADAFRPLAAEDFPWARDDEVPGGAPGSTRQLINKYNAMFVAWQNALDAKKTVAAKRKDDVKQWVRYANKLERRLKRHGISLPHTTVRQDGSDSILGKDSTCKVAPGRPTKPGGLISPSEAIEKVVTATSTIPASPTANLEDDTLLGSPDAASTKSTHPESLNLPPIISRITRCHIENDVSEVPSYYSSSTQGEIDDAQTVSPNASTILVKTESQTDSPVFVSSRSVRKTKSHGSAGATTSPGKVKVKDELEEIRSSTLDQLRPQCLDSHDSVDLDEVGEKVDTPKKTRRFLEASRAMYRRQADSAKVKNESYNHTSLARDSALQPQSPNKRVLPRTTDSARIFKRRRTYDRVQGADLFAEDGENGFGSDHSYKHGRSLKDKLRIEQRKDHNTRLDNLLNTPSPRRQPMTPVAVSKAEGLKASATDPIPRRKLIDNGEPSSGYAGRGSASTAKLISPMRKSARKAHVPQTKEEMTALEADDPDHEPFRARPLRRLGLDHFKVNPSSNEGYDYAFADVIRGKEQRKCLAGCTNPECCGNAFRKLAEITMATDEEQTSSQEERDRRLLEDFLGSRRDQLLTMSMSEKSSLLVQARARDLAKKHGKHRYTFERRRSPPGFWRADFPTTQEEEEDRAEAAKIERGLVEQRYNEAMREGGAWMFRDE